MSIDIEYLGSCVFEELASNYLAYTSSLSECKVVDHYFDNDVHTVVLSVNEIGKTPYRIKLETKIVGCEKEKLNAKENRDEKLEMRTEKLEALGFTKDDEKERFVYSGDGGFFEATFNFIADYLWKILKTMFLKLEEK